MERVNTFFEANDVEEDAKKRAVFLTSVGERTYTTLRNLTSPETPANTSWANIQKLLKDHYMPLANPIVERCKFYERYRQSGETVATFLAELRALADKCDFGEQLTVALRDRLVCGIADDRMQRRLLAEPYKDLKLERAVDICTAMETASKNVQRLQETKPVGPAVNAVSHSSEKQQRHKQQTGS